MFGGSVRTLPKRASTKGQMLHCQVLLASSADLGSGWGLCDGFPKLGVPFLGVPMIIVFGGLYGGPPILGNYHVI